MIKAIEIMTTEEAGAYIGVNPLTIRRWIEAGKLPSMRTRSGKYILWASDVERIKQERESNA